MVYLIFLLPLWLTGLISLLRNRRVCPIGIACAVPLLIFLFVGKSYFAAGTIPIALAQGLMAICQIELRKLRVGFEIAVVVATVLEFGAFFQLLVPITPPDRLHAAGLDARNEVFADSVGWDDVANEVATIYADLPAAERTNTVIVSAYCGVPGALHVFGNPDNRLPRTPRARTRAWSRAS